MAKNHISLKIQQQSCWNITLYMTLRELEFFSALISSSIKWQKQFSLQHRLFFWKLIDLIQENA